MTRHTLAWLCVLLLGATASLARSIRPSDSPWDNFGVGAWVIIHTKTTAPDQDDEQRVRMSIIRKTDTRPIVGVAWEINGKFENRVRAAKHVPGFRPDQLGMTLEKTRSDQLTIDGTRYTCRTERYRSHEPGKKLTRKLKLWHAPKIRVPYREIIVDHGANVALGPHVVRAEYTVTLGQRTTTHRLDLTAAEAPIEVGSQTLRCVLEEGSADVREGQEYSTVRTKRWLSAKVPGHVVMMRGTLDADGFEVQKVQRVEAFEAASPE